MGCGGPVCACISQPEGRTEAIMHLRSLNRVLRNINTEEGKKIQEDVFFFYGYFEGVIPAESGTFICYQNRTDG